jgi:hypothetical protein
MEASTIHLIRFSSIQLDKKILKYVNDVITPLYHINKSTYLQEANKKLNTDLNFEQYLKSNFNNLEYELGEFEYECNITSKTTKQRNDIAFKNRKYNYEIYITATTAKFELLKEIDNLNYVCFNTATKTPFVLKFSKLDEIVIEKVKMCSDATYEINKGLFYQQN